MDRPSFVKSWAQSLWITSRNEHYADVNANTSDDAIYSGGYFGIYIPKLGGVFLDYHSGGG